MVYRYHVKLFYTILLIGKYGVAHRCAAGKRFTIHIAIFEMRGGWAQVLSHRIYDRIYDRINHLETIPAPTVVLQGQADPLVPVASAEDIVARLPSAALRLIPGLGHDTPIELVTTFADAITDASERASD